MPELRIGDQLIRFDRDATVAAYAQTKKGEADFCGCSGCRNFVLVRNKAYPTAFLELSNTLGIDPKKEGEAIHYGPIEGDVHFYGGWFYIVGEMIEEGERLPSMENVQLARATQDLKTARGFTFNSDFQYWFSSVFPRPPATFGLKVVTLEFEARIPWVLDEPWNPKSDAMIVKAKEVTKEIMARYLNALERLANS